MAASVQVLCPNGRRQTVKVTPNTKLLQILEEVCQRQGFVPPEDFKLVQGRKDLDLSLSIRFSGLPNNAKLELIRSTTSRVEQDVTIALQLDSGQRLQHSFSPSISLWDLLVAFEEKNEAYKGQLARVEGQEGRQVHPVCIFMREEVIGEPALKATTLKKLALTSGKAIIRLLHRPVEESTIADINVQVEKDKAKQAQLEEIGQQRKGLVEELERNEAFNGTPGGGRTLDDVMEEGEVIQSQQPVAGEAMDVDRQGEDTLSSASFSGDSSARHRSPRTVTSTPNPQPPPQTREIHIPGAQVFTPDDFHDLTPTEQAIARRLAQRFMPHLQQAVASNSADRDRAHSSHIQQPRDDFIDFKFPEHTKGQDLTNTGGRDSIQANTTACEREPLVYNGMDSLPISNQHLPDSFFDVTQADVRLMYKDLQTATKNFDDQPLMTKSLKQAQTEAAYDNYERIVIRVHFPDKLVLQASFRPRETVGALHKFVRDCLQEKQLKFHLYTTPPKTVLKDMKSSLAMNYLAPAALVYFGCQEDRDHYLDQSLVDKLRTRLEAETQVNVILNNPDISYNTPDMPGPSSSSSHQTSAASTSGGAATSNHSHTPSSPSTLPSGAKVPKWLKLGKK